MTATTSHALVGMLRRHYLPENRPPAGIFAPEVESPCGKRRADAVWMPTTMTGRSELVGHEIKVSRADVLVELADPTKADAWARYCTRWWLVVAHPSLVDGLDVPDYWGVLAPPSGRRTRSMTVLRPAPKLTPIEPAPAYRRLAAWTHYRSVSRVAELEGQLRLARRDVDLERQRASDLRAAGARSSTPAERRIAEVLELVRAAQRGDTWLDDATAADVAATVADLSRVRAAVQTARWELAALQRAVTEPMSSLARALERLSVPEVKV